MDQEAFVAALNEDLETEFQSIVQYVSHIATISGAEFLSTIDELKVHLGQELQHAQILAEQVSFLDGVPSTRVPAVEHIEDGRTALAADLKLEEGQLERYRERFSRRWTWAWPMSQKHCDRFSSRPRSTCAISRPSLVEPSRVQGEVKGGSAWTKDAPSLI